MLGFKGTIIIRSEKKRVSMHLYLNHSQMGDRQCGRDIESLTQLGRLTKTQCI